MVSGGMDAPGRKDNKCNKVNKYFCRVGLMVSVRVSVVENLFGAALYFPLVLWQSYCLRVKHSAFY